MRGTWSRYSLVVFILAACCLTTQAAVINEFRIDRTGGGNDDYVEIRGASNESLGDLTYLVIYKGADEGRIHTAVSLSGESIGSSDNYFVVASEQFGTYYSAPEPADKVVTGLDFPHNSSTHMLVSGFTGSVNQDLDTNDDGTLEVTPWSAIVDSVALQNDLETAMLYSTTILNWADLYYPHQPLHVLRQQDVGAWATDTNCWTDMSFDTPARKNLLLLGESQTGTFGFDGGTTIVVSSNSNYQVGLVVTQSAGDPGGTCDGSSATAPGGATVTPDQAAKTRYWTVESRGIWDTFTYNVSLDIGGMSDVKDADRLLIMKRPNSGSDWHPFSTTRSGSMLTATGLNSFSEFGIGSDNQGLPVSLSQLSIE